jgi:carbonic anhydrase
MQTYRSLGQLGIVAALPMAFVMTGCGGTAPAATPAAPPAATSAAVPAATPAAAASSRPSAAPATADPVWHYEGAEGPANWGTLTPKFATCGAGRAQSPIDIVSPAPGKEAELAMQFAPAALRIAHHTHVADGINNGHTIQINYEGADTLTIGTEKYELAQYHFHNRSEHTVKGAHFPMEMHLVHKSAAGKLAVIGVFIEAGAHNAAFDPIWTNLPKAKGVETHYPSVQVDIDALLPKQRASYRYDGSLTTPPCTEGVKWIVMTTPIQLSSEQIGSFTALIHDNNRPPQPLNGRAVVLDSVGTR